MEDASQLRDKYLTCSICYDVFTEPKTLPCLHSFCEKCLSDYIFNLDQSLVRKEGFSCPYCREEIRLPCPKRPSAEWVSQFKTNFHMKDIIVHLSKQKIPKQKFTPKCTNHPTKELDLYCDDHEQLICHLCAGISHRSCQNVLPASEAVDATKDKFQASLNDWHCRVAVIETGFSAIGEERDRLFTLKKTVSGEIRKEADRLKTRIGTLEEQLQSELEHGWEVIDTDITSKLSELDAHLHGRQLALAKAVDFLSTASDDQILSKDNNDTLACFKPLNSKDVSTYLRSIQGINVKFTTFPESTEQLKGFGRIKFSRPKSERNETDKRPLIPFKPKPDTIVRPISLKTTKPMRVRKDPFLLQSIEGQMREDEQTPKFKDVVVLQLSGTIIVSDWNNSCLKAYPKRRDKDLRLLLGGKPWGLAALTDTQAAVSIPLAHQICVVKVTTNSLMLMSSVVATRRYMGLAKVNEATLVATGGNDPPVVDIINLGGEVLRSFSLDSSGSPLLTSPEYVSFSASNDIIVSDKMNGSVISLNPKTGEINFCFQPDGHLSLQEPRGLFCHTGGMIYVVEKRGVVVLSPDGVFQGTLLKQKSGLQDPVSIFFDDSGTIYVIHKESELAIFKSK
ncbi:hypothetical protein SNE40_002195 [Patella caerulea]|uniref:Uncharacterized protein n=1 Tax=Patella caerulea TaxID=87958 RepID=A0AAN8KBC0_PATCE